MGTSFGRLWRKLTSPTPGQTSSATEPADQDDQPIQSCREREKVTVTGRIASVTPARAGQDPSLTIEVADPSGSVSAVWLGRRSIPGIEAGRTVRLEGRVSRRSGDLTLYNPRYELLHDRA